MSPYGNPRGYGGPPRPLGLPEEDDLYGLRLEDFMLPDQVQPEMQAPASRGDQILALLGQSMQGTEMPAPQGFGQGLLSGLFRGLGGEGLRRQGERQKLDQAAQERAQARNAANLEASRAYRTARVGAVQERGKEARAEALKIGAEGRAESRDVAKFEREQPARDRKDRLQMDRDARAQATADRAVSASERQARLDQVRTVGQLHDDYGKDKDIQSYRGAVQNLDQMRSLAKESTGPSDLAFLTSFARAIEPPGVISVVREEDLRNASQSVGKMRRFLNLPREYFSGERLTEPGRREVLAAAEKITNSRKASHDLAEGQYGSRAELGGVDPTQFIRPYAPTGSTQSRSTPPASATRQPGGFFDVNRLRAR